MKWNGIGRLLAGLLALIMVLVLLPTVSAQADGEIEIASYADLKVFAARVNGGEEALNAKLTEDITCTDKTWTPIGTDNESYEGTFNGQGHTITGLSNADVDYSGLSADDEVYIGLFGRSYGTVKNVVIEDCDLSFASDADGYVYMGAVVGRNGGTVEACSVSGKLSAALTSYSVTARVGGVVGDNHNTVKTCTNSGAVSVSGNYSSICVGGVVGNDDSSVQNCANTGAVSGAGYDTVGGIAGSGVSVKNCFNTGAISGENGSTGGIVGYTAYGTVENCLNVGTVTGDSLAGGVIGQNSYGTVKTCLSVGAVSGSGRYNGGVVGICPDNASVKSYVENCYCLDTSASAAIGNAGSAVVTSVSALTAEQLKSLSNCVGFSTDTWYEGLSYPVLKNLSGEVHLYANSNEDLVLQRFICAYAPTKIANPFTYADHDFTGWNTQADGEGDPYDETHEFTLLPGETLTLHAQWRDAVVEIANYEQLKAFAARVNGGEYGLNAKITSDFTCPTATDWTPICPESEHGYTGTFNGNNCVITGLKFNQTITSDATQLQRWYIGLFGVIGTGGTVQDLYLKDCSIQVSVSAPYFNLYEGAVAGRNFGTITACGVFGEGEISGARTGGDKSANAFVGGIAGYNNGIITDSCFIGTVNVQSNASSNGFSPAEIGGIAGRNPSGGNRTAIENCFHSGSVIASGGDFVQTSVGGIVGTNYAGLRNCRHNGSVQGVESKSNLYNTIGGVAGTNGVQGIITYCYARSAVEELEGGSGLLYLGGVVGANNGGSTSDCFCDTTLAPDTEAIGYVGSGSLSDVVGLASEAFADESNFSGWENFDMNWVMGVDQPEVKALSAPVRLYANSNEDVVILNNIPVCTPVKFANPFTYEGHEFTGWNTQADGDGVPYSEDDEITLLPGETLSLSAQWKTNAFMIMFQNEDGTELQKGLVNAGETPVYEGETPEKEATVEHSYTFAGWKDENGIVYGLTDDLPAVTGAMTYTAIYTQREIVYGEPEWTWTGYESAEATFTGTDGETLYTQLLPADEITHMTTVEPDCENPGIVTYTASVIFLGKTYYNNKNKEIAPRGHEWVFDEFVWQKNAQGVYYALAQFHCARVESHTLTVNPVGGMATDPATCTEDGCEHYVAFLNEFESPDGQYHEDKLEVVIPAHGHQWSAPDYERIETETGYDVYAIVRCYYDYSHRIEETVHAVYEVITPPTLYEDGLGRYTADFTDDRLWDIQWEVTIPMLALGLYGEDVDALDVVEHTGDGETLYRYDVMLRNDAEVLPIASVQMFIAYDDALTFVEAKTELHDAVIQDGNGVIALAWATDEGVMMENGTVVASLYFKLTGDVPNGGVLPFRFVEQNGNQSTVSYLADGTPVEAAAFETVDGSIVFAIPDAITIAGEDVLSGDIYTIEDGRILYRYNIRVRDLPEAGLWINSAQIFVSFDHAVLSVARTEGMLDWTTSESGDKLMAVWASDEDVQISEGDVVLTVWFEKIGEAPEDGVVPITFTTNLMGNASAASITFCGAVAEIAADTVDGSITFEPILYGDANCDGEITAADAALILRAIVGLSELTPRGVLNADANGDLEITAEDAALILRYVVGLIGSLPA